MASIEITESTIGLRKGTNWWGAFVIGLAGTILVTGIAPVVVNGLGPPGILLIGGMTILGCFLCFCLAELATVWPDRTGGIPSFATESFRPLVGDTWARHIGGTSGWAYWLGWFPVAPINVILTSLYLAELFNFSQGSSLLPVGATWGAPIGVNVLIISMALLALIYIPAYFGIRLGAGFATFLGVLSMLPLTAMVFLPFFKSGAIHWHNVAGFHLNPGLHGSPTLYFAWLFPILWNVIAMEAAACYVGECRGGARDAKIAMTVEGIYGMFIYIMTPLMFVAVLGALVSTTFDPLTMYLTYTDKIFGHGSWEKWFVGIPLILALALSVLNAIMGVGRSLYQAAEDGQLPRFFQHKNRHGVPDWSMAFNVVCAMLLVLLGSPVRIYIISNGGYLLSCALAFAGYFVFRHWSPDTPRPFRLPTIAKWGALIVFLGWMVIYFFGGWNSPKVVVGPTQGPGLYILGLVIVALYAPLYWWRAWQDRKLAARGGGPAVGVAGDGAGTSDVVIIRDSVPAGETPGEPPLMG